MVIKAFQKSASSRPSLGERIAIAEMVREILEDPDFRRELSSEAKQRLRRAEKDRRVGIPFAEIKRRYG